MVFHMVDASWVSHKKAEKGGGFSAQFSGIFIFTINWYNMDLSCSKSTIKSFIMQPDNDLYA